jgi:hypothetical protein
LRSTACKDDAGRGPWRPGLSRFWVDEDSDRPLVQETSVDLLRRAGVVLRPGWHYGCACRSFEALLAWFTPVEVGRLGAMGFSVVRLEVDRVVAESEHQLVFARRVRLNRDIVRLPWPER